MGAKIPSYVDFMSLFRLEEERRLAAERSTRMIRRSLHTVALSLILIFGVFAVGLIGPAKDVLVVLGILMLLLAAYYAWKAWKLHQRSIFYAGRCTEMAFEYRQAISTVRRRLHEMESQRVIIRQQLASMDAQNDAVLMDMVRELMAKAEQIPPGGMNK